MPVPIVGGRSGTPPRTAAISKRAQSELDEQLEFLELQENTVELDDLVCELKQELQGVKGSPRNSPRGDDEVAAERGKGGGGLSKPEYVIRPLPNAPGRGAGGGGERFDNSCNPCEDLDRVELNHYLKAVMQRLSRLEQRLEEWRFEQQGWLERALHTTSLHQRVARSSGLDWALLKETPPQSTWSAGAKRAKKPRISRLSLRSPPVAVDEDGLFGLRGTSAGTDGGEGPTQIGEDRTIFAQVEAVDKVTGKRLEVPDRVGSASSSEEAAKGKRSVVSTASKKQEALNNSVLLNAKSVDFSGNSNHNGKTTSILSPLVSHPAFDYFFATMILLNSLFIGVQTEVKVRNIGKSEPEVFDIVEKVFVALFALELTLRMIAMKWTFFSPKTLTWNLFDMVLVAMSLVEVTLNAVTGDSGADSSGSAGKVIRMFRMARIVRIMRVLRFLAELRIMVTLIMHSARSLFWLMCLLVIILYVFSIFFTQGATDYLKSEIDQTNTTTYQELEKHYGSLISSAFTLFASITGGVSWRDVLEPLSQTGWDLTVLFHLYIFFCVFSVLNIVTGVFVDGAIQRSSQERDLRLEKEKEQKKMYVSMLTDLLTEIDSEGTGVITREDLQDAFKIEQVRYYFSVLDIDVVDSNYLFDMLDLDRSGEVDMEEFVSGCLRLKGNAKSIDIHTLMYEVKEMIKQTSLLMEYCDPRLAMR